MIKCVVVSDRPFLYNALSGIKSLTTRVNFVLAHTLEPGHELYILDKPLISKEETAAIIIIEGLPITLASLISKLESALSTLESRVKLGDLSLDTIGRALSSAGNVVSLTELESRILSHLMQHFPKIISKEDIKTSILGYSADSQTSTIDNHIYHLRMKITTLTSQVTIDSTEAGYKLTLPA